MPRKTYAEFTPAQKKRQIERNAAYAKKAYAQISLHFHATNDADVLARLANQPNKADYIRRLIRADIAKENETEE